MRNGLASQGDLADKRKTLAELAEGVHALTAEGNPKKSTRLNGQQVQHAATDTLIHDMPALIA